MTVRNPSEKPCWRLCPSCMKCMNKRLQSGDCGGCSGKHDPMRRLYADPDVFCDCAEGILRHRTQKGQLIIRRFHSNPFGGKVQTDARSQDERDWNAFVAEKRELLDDPDWDPIQFYAKG